MKLFKSIVLSIAVLSITTQAYQTREQAISKLNARFDISETKKANTQAKKQARKAIVEKYKQQSKSLQESKRAELSALKSN